MTESPSVRIRPMERADCAHLSAAFARIGWSKQESLFLHYVAEERDGLRAARVGEVDGVPVGYVTLVWRSTDPALSQAGYPEIIDLNVLPDFRGRGVGSLLLDHVEALAAERSPTVGLRVGLHPGYGSAQRLYSNRGYRLDGAGALRNGYPVPEGATVELDDELTLRMYKALR